MNPFFNRKLGNERHYRQERKNHMKYIALMFPSFISVPNINDIQCFIRLSVALLLTKTKKKENKNAMLYNVLNSYFADMNPFKVHSKTNNEF